MASKGLILFCFLLALHKNFLELQCPGSEPVEQEPTEGLRLGSVIRSLRRPGFMGLNLITRPKRQPTKGNNALYLALLLLCAGDIETNPGPTNIITWLIILLFLYITLDGCGWSSSFSLAAPVMVFSRESNINGGGSGDSGGGNDNSKGDDRVAIISSTVVVAAAIITATGTIIAAIIGAITKCKCCSCKKLVSSSNDSNPVDLDPVDPVDACAKELKDFYKAHNQSNYNAAEDLIQWPPPSYVADIHKFIRLAMIRAEDKLRQGQPDDSIKRKRKIDERVDKPYKEKDSIELENIFTVEDQTINKVLVEGAPGSGKSTLSLHICHQWAVGKLFEEFKLVILVRLRDPNVRQAKDIADLLPKGKWWTEATVNKIKKDNGREVLFVLDGWDELPKQHQHWFLEFIKPGSAAELSGSSLVITSRPVSSIVLQKLVSSRIVILGFDQENLREYFKSVLKRESRADNLIKTISRKPMIEGSCYLPLNASILVYLYKHNSEYKLPDTQYEIFKKLICNCITRHLWKMEPSDNFTCHCRKKTNHTRVINCLDDLSGKDKDVFDWLCEIAYDGIVKDKVMFELEPGINTLGLLEGVESLVDNTESLFSYNFLHLSIQELLAAIHMATKLTDEEQTEKFSTKFGNEDRFAAVFRFFAAETKLINPGIGEVVKKVARSKSGSLLLDLMHCLFEAQDPKLYQLVVGELESSLDLSYVRLKSRIDCYSLGDFLTHCNDFMVDLMGCYIDDEGCKALFGRREGKDYYFPIKYLILQNNSIGDEGAKVLSDAIKTMANLKGLRLSDNSIGDEGAKALSDAIKTMANLQWLRLDGNSIGDEGAKALSDAIKTMANLKALRLDSNSIGDEGAKALSDAIKTMANLETLFLHTNSIGDEGAKVLSDAIKTMANLKTLYLSYNSIGDEGAKVLSDAIKTMANLQRLDLRGNDAITDEGRRVLREAAKEKGIVLGLEDFDDIDDDLY